jgi:hypothetical protein
MLWQPVVASQQQVLHLYIVYKYSGHDILAAVIATDLFNTTRRVLRSVTI